jgi:micrococcal nuclease
MKKLIIIILLIIIQGCSTAENSRYVSRVVYINDGDTVRLANGESVRYLGIDTPEMDYKTFSHEHMAKEAKEFNKDLVYGKTVRLEFDVEKRDKYGRLLAYVYVDDIFVNAKLIEEGYARLLVFPPNTRHADYLLELQNKARENKKGLWAR